MPARAQYRWAAFLLVAALLTACGGGSSSAGVSAPMPHTPPPMVATKLPGLHGQTSQLTIDDVALEAVHPADVTATLAGFGLVAVSDRTLTGSHGALSRVTIRSWEFSSEEGATSFVSWLASNTGELLPDAHPVDAGLPEGVVLLRHDVTGCCHEEVPIYLAVWQRGAIVWTIRASGARIHTAPVVALVRSVEEET